MPLAAAYACGVGLPVCTRRDPTRSAPNTPSTSPCTWNSGRPWTSVSSGDHCHAFANPSRSAATARRDSTTPFGKPVVPDVYMISAVASADGSPPVQSDSPSTGICGSVTSAHCGSPIVAAAPESRSMCSRSMGPASDGHRHHRHTGDETGHDADHGVERVGRP